MRKMNKPTIRPGRRVSTKRELVIVPFFTDILVNAELYRFVFPEAMTLVRAVIEIDKMLMGPLVLIGEIKSDYKRMSINKSVTVGVNIFDFNIPGDTGDLFVLRFDDRNLSKGDISGITVSLTMKI